MSRAYKKTLPEPKLIYVIDFFCGCGGMSFGFQQTRQSHLAFKILAGLDIDKKALLTFQKNVNAPAIVKDIREIERNPAELTRLVPTFDPLRCRPLTFIGCAPCQGFSAHRKKDRRDDPRNSLMMSFARICAHFKPDTIVMENVPEIIVGKYASYFSVAARELESAGYNLAIGVLDTSLYGVPQRRRRAIVLGSLNGAIALPQPVFSKENAVTVRAAISHLPRLRAGACSRWDPCHRAPSHTIGILERIRRTPKDGGDRRSLAASEQLKCHSSVDGGPTPGFTDVYGRLRWDTPSITITAKSSTPSCGRFLHPEQHRNISVREAALLQGFPHAFMFEGNLVHQYRQIGEAVPPLLARHLAWQILDHSRPRRREDGFVFRQEERRVDRNNAEQAHGMKVVDCFCGAGGLSLGFHAAGVSTAFAFDADPHCVSTFTRNISSVATVMDARARGLAAKISRAVGKSPFVLVGGPPCQGFSQQRRGDNSDSRNNLVIRQAELVRSLKKRPFAVVLENVTYIDSPRGHSILWEYTRLLESMGYKIFRHDLNSTDYAVPQLRRRVLIVGVCKAMADSYKGPRALTAKRWPSVGEVLQGLGDPESKNLVASAVPNHIASREGGVNKRRIAFVDMGGGRLAIPPALQLPCHVKYDGHLDVYGRLDWFSQARTITGGFDSFTRGEYGHPFRHRSITPREAARIQGFPDWFVFEGVRAAVRRQIGNAVPPPMAFAVAKALKSAFKKCKGVV